LLRAWEEALVSISGFGPVVLVVDDVQWADASSLDVLAYLVSGLRHQRVCLFLIYRDGELPDGHMMHGWLADLRRLPVVEDLTLHRLSESDTLAQLRSLLRRDPAPQLVHAVWLQSGGNPYLTELLVRGLNSDAVAIPEELPAELRDAMLAGWHRLTPPTRSLTQVLAVAGRPSTTARLRAVTHRWAGKDAEVQAQVREAAGAGIAVLEGDGRVWFRHPLLAEVLYATLLPEERSAVHAAFADTRDCEQVPVPDDAGGAGSPHLTATLRLADHAVHCEHAGRVDEAFEQYLAAAQRAHAVPAIREEAVLRRRALALWPRVSAEVRTREGTEVDLLTATAEATRWAGDEPAAARLLDRARDLLDDGTDPVTAARVLTLAAETAYTVGAGDGWRVEDLTQAAALTEPLPDTAEHARALADLAQSEAWRGHWDEARAYVDRAEAAAHRAGDPATMTWVHFARSLAYFGQPAGREAAEAARCSAAASEQPEYIALAHLAMVNALESEGRIADCATTLVEGYTAAQHLGVGGMTSYLGLHAAQYLLSVGETDRADQLLREVLAAGPVGAAGAEAHIWAMVAAVRRDDLVRAGGHLDAARALAPHFEHTPGLHGPAALAEYLLAAGQPVQAMAMLHDTIRAHAASEPRYADEMLAWGARAAADQAARVRDASGPARRALEGLRRRRSLADVPSFADVDEAPTQRATHAVYRAEVARLTRSDDAAEQWGTAAAAAAAAGLRYMELEALARLADTLAQRGQRRPAAAPLRAAHRLAKELHAVAVMREVEALARLARIDVTDSAALAQQALRQRPALDGLTRREREILARLVTGRSYAEIAEELFISQKTVGVHVSNLLRKTGNANRVAVAAWARRQGVDLLDDAGGARPDAPA
jgi:DNA-binding NarL/FixJ family response regulator